MGVCKETNRRENHTTVLATLKSGCCFAFSGAGHLHCIDSTLTTPFFRDMPHPPGLIFVEKEPHCSRIMSPSASKL